MIEGLIKNGTGWRLGWNPQREGYQGLVGGEDWAIELTAPELKDFCTLLQQLAAAMAAMAEELMPEETITCEAETELLWMEVSGFPHSYGVRFILNTGRGFEGGWAGAIVPELLAASEILKDF
jgi:hypothetical protein